MFNYFWSTCRSFVCWFMPCCCLVSWSLYRGSLIVGTRVNYSRRHSPEVTTVWTIGNYTWFVFVTLQSMTFWRNYIIPFSCDYGANILPPLNGEYYTVLLTQILEMCLCKESIYYFSWILTSLLNLFFPSCLKRIVFFHWPR